MFPLVRPLSCPSVKIFSGFFFHAGSCALLSITHKCVNGWKATPVILRVQVFNGTHSWVGVPAAVTLSICCIWPGSYFIQIASVVGGLQEHMVNYFCQAPFIFSHRVILHLQREQKDSYYCVLSYVAFISSAFYFLPICGFLKILHEFYFYLPKWQNLHFYGWKKFRGDTIFIYPWQNSI